MEKIELNKLHDWEVITISTDYRKKRFTIKLNQPVSGIYKKIEFIDVIDLYVSNMKLQNVILDVIVFEESCDTDYFNYCSKLLCLDDLKIFKNYNLIYFEPSVGVEIACVFREIQVTN